MSGGNMNLHRPTILLSLFITYHVGKLLLQKLWIIFSGNNFAMYNQTLCQFSLIVVEVDQTDYVFVLKASALPLTKIRHVHGSSRIKSILGLTWTWPAGIEWRVEEPETDCRNQSVELVSGEGERWWVAEI